jgi:hypothetical protein
LKTKHLATLEEIRAIWRTSRGPNLKWFKAEKNEATDFRIFANRVGGVVDFTVVIHDRRIQSWILNYGFIRLKLKFKKAQYYLSRAYHVQIGPTARKQGCRMVYFLTKNRYLGKFGRALEWKILVYFMPIWNMLWHFGIFYGNFGSFVVIWNIFPHFGILGGERSGNPARRPFNRVFLRS